MMINTVAKIYICRYIINTKYTNDNVKNIIHNPVNKQKLYNLNIFVRLYLLIDLIVTNMRKPLKFLVSSPSL